MLITLARVKRLSVGEPLFAPCRSVRGEEIKWLQPRERKKEREREDEETYGTKRETEKRGKRWEKETGV